MPWVYDPHSGGVKIPPTTKDETERRIRAYANRHYAGKFARIDVRFRGELCYIDAFLEPAEPDAKFLDILGETREQYLERMRNEPVHLVRLRHFTKDRWSVGFFAYSSEKYEPAMLPSGKWEGTPEEGFELGAMYLQD